MTDKRLDDCPANPHRKHRWAQSFREKLSKTRFFQVLRCRYCANYLLVQFERTVLPSGRVTVTQAVDVVPTERFTDHVTQALRSGGSEGSVVKAVE
jgi:hypothetical protein